MINKQLLNPQSIVVIGASNDVKKPGGKVLKNILDGNFKENLYVVNPKESEIQGIKSYKTVEELPEVDLAILAIAAKFCVDTVEILAKQKNTKAFIILSAGFSEENEQGKIIENKIVEIINSVNGSLIGPNCIGMLNTNYNGIFTTPIPKLDKKGIDMISGSGATAVFIMESALPKGLTFNSVYSVGNSAQMGVEEVLKYMDENFNPDKDPKIKLLYIENIVKPDMLLKHASSLIRKGCKIAAIKSGSSVAGSRAASSHTGALASPDVAVEALFKKAGIVRCYGREDLATVAAVFQHNTVEGNNFAIITHAGGPGVMLTDALSKGGLEVPRIEGDKANELLTLLYPGSSVANPIDFLATGNAEQLGNIIDYCEKYFENIDAIIVIFGSPGLFPVFDVYDVLHEKMKTCKKPIFPVLPSLSETAKEITQFQSKGRQSFPDEVLLAQAITKVVKTPKPFSENFYLPEIDKVKIRNIIENSSNGYLSPNDVFELLSAANIPAISEAVFTNVSEAVKFANKIGYPVVMKVVGPVHKSDVGGVILNVKNAEQVENEFKRMILIKDTTAILIQPMISGIELFVGAKREEKFGHTVICGLGGIFIEVLKDIQTGLAPLSKEEAVMMIKNLRSYKIIQGVRGQEGVNEEQFADIIQKISVLVSIAPEIFEMDLNPLLGKKDNVIAVDARINIQK